jgi:hypothetical protein
LGSGFFFGTEWCSSNTSALRAERDADPSRIRAAVEMQHSFAVMTRQTDQVVRVLVAHDAG